MLNSQQGLDTFPGCDWHIKIMTGKGFIKGALRFLTIVFALIAIIFIGATAFVLLAPAFGGKSSGESLQRIERSGNYQNGRFVNLVETVIDTREPGTSLGLSDFFFPPKGKNPSKPVPSVRFDASSFKAGEFVWLGHSTILFRTTNLNVLVDPVFNRASPVPIAGKAFEMEIPPTIDTLPDIDIVLITHDHYDHLDHLAIRDLANTTKIFIVPLGIQAHLLRWGVADEQIVELDWYESHIAGDSTFMLTPSRHFSGRGLTNRFSTLWGSWVIETPDSKIFHSGDSGYFDEFVGIGKRFGPFDIAFIENGAYDKNWSQIHMEPEQSAQVSIDLQANVFFPIHWGKFDLSHHPWREPIERAVQEAERLGLTVAAPMVGQVFTIENPPFETWWNK